MSRQAFDFYETPETLTQWLFDSTSLHCFHDHILEPCAGTGAIPRAVAAMGPALLPRWITNDLDTRFACESAMDAASPAFWATVPKTVRAVVSNFPFTLWREIATLALDRQDTDVVALYLRLSALEPSKGVWRNWWQTYSPNRLYVCPRFAHQRSLKTGKWTTDSVTCAWVMWDKRLAAHDQRIIHAPEDVLTALEDETPKFRARMDALMEAR